jgi:hypothetical protein
MDSTTKHSWANGFFAAGLASILAGATLYGGALMIGATVTPALSHLMIGLMTLGAILLIVAGGLVLSARKRAVAPPEEVPAPDLRLSVPPNPSRVLMNHPAYPVWRLMVSNAGDAAAHGVRIQVPTFIQVSTGKQLCTVSENEHLLWSAIGQGSDHLDRTDLAPGETRLFDVVADFPPAWEFYFASEHVGVPCEDDYLMNLLVGGKKFQVKISPGDEGKPFLAVVGDGLED